jgi:CubicO group peptidase (beta-lactamase class C family)
MRRVIAILAVASALVWVAPDEAAQGPRATRAARSAGGAIDARLAQAVERGDVPGIVAVAVNRGGVIYEGAFGVADAGTRRPLQADAIFRIASMTKPVTSVAAMQLVEQHLVGLDDPAEKYLPELADLKVFETFDAGTGAYTVRPAATKLTVRHLLTHTSGLGYNFTSPIVRDFKPRFGEHYAAGPLLFEPGTQWIYGTSVDWIGRLVERIGGKPLDEYFQDRIFGPLGMADTAFKVDEGKAARVVPVHRRRADGAFEATANQQRAAVSGGGGLFSTARDYARFVQMFLDGGALDGARILTAESVRLMGQNQIGTVGVRALKTAVPDLSSDFSFVADGRDKWGIGFLISTAAVKGKRSPGSLSWGGLDNTYFWIDPERGTAGIILMQFLPFADGKALGVYDAFERGVYELAGPPTR